MTSPLQGLHADQPATLGKMILGHPMLDDEDKAPQGAPQGETAPQPANNERTDTGADQSPQPEDQAKEPEKAAEGEGDKPKFKPWFQTRIDDLTREKWNTRRELEAATAELTRLRGAQDQQQRQETDPNEARYTREDVDRLAREQASHSAAQSAFDATCNAIHDAGAKAYGDFGDALQSFRLLGGLPPALIEAAAETGEAAKVLYELGKNPDEAARIMSLSPTRMAVAVAKVATRQPSPPPVSAAPPPIKPLAGSARVETNPDKMSASEWKAWREKQLTH